ncbi:MAG: hypothetical protein ACLQVX_15190 [Limisphaerales bacterium]
MKSANSYDRPLFFRAGLLQPEERLLGYPWSSPGYYLAARPKSGAGRLEIAARVRRETTLTLKQIAERPHLGAPRGASVRLHLATKEPTRRMPAQGNLAI